MGLSRKQIAEAAGVEPRTITNICCGGLVGVPTAVRIGSVIGWTADEVIAGERETSAISTANEDTSAPPAGASSAEPGRARSEAGDVRVGRAS